MEVQFRAAYRECRMPFNGHSEKLVRKQKGARVRTKLSILWAKETRNNDRRPIDEVIRQNSQASSEFTPDTRAQY